MEKGKHRWVDILIFRNRSYGNGISTIFLSVIVIGLGVNKFTFKRKKSLINDNTYTHRQLSLNLKPTLLSEFNMYSNKIYE